MSTASSPAGRWPRFTMRTVLTVMVLLGLLLGWSTSEWRYSQRMQRMLSRLQYAEEELDRARQELRDQTREITKEPRVFFHFELDGANLRGVTIASTSNAFQRASLKHCDLQNATLEGGTAAFQLARFDHAKLVDARLRGGASSFQLAVFDGADLTGAVLHGKGAAFQRASFENAQLVRASLIGSFQLVNFSGARFEGADLSALNHSDLASCYFKEPPTYDAATKFPTGFDPIASLWRRAD